MTTGNITLGDGRVLCVHEFGDPAGRPVVFCHGGGLGATGRFAAYGDESARRLGLRVLAPDRPGLGGSSLRPRRTVLDWPRDVAAMTDALGVGAFHVVAHSGGAGLAPDFARAARLAALAGVRLRSLRFEP